MRVVLGILELYFEVYLDERLISSVSNDVPEDFAVARAV